MVIALAVLSLLGCAPGRDWSGLAKIGVVAPFSGYDAGTAAQVLASLKQSVDQHNRAGKTPFAVELVALDDTGQGVAAEAKARELAIDPSVVVALAFAHGDLALDVYQRLGLPLFAYGGPAIPPASAGVKALCADAKSEGIRATARARQVRAGHPAVVEAAGEGYQAAASAFVDALGLAASRLIVNPVAWRADRGYSTAVRRELTAQGIDFVYFSGPYDLAAQLAPGPAGSWQLLAGSDADTPAFERMLVDMAGVRRVAVCTVAGEASGENGAQRPATLATSAAEDMLAAIEAVARLGIPTRSAISVELGQRVAAGNQVGRGDAAPSAIVY